MSAAVTGTGASASPPPQRTIISHRELADAANDFSDPPEVTERGGADDSSLQPNDANGHNDDSMIETADEVFQRAASATSAPVKTTGKKSRTTAPKSPKTATTKAAKPAKAAKETKSAPRGKDEVEFAGEKGPDNSMIVDGEQQWEISDIVGQEGDVLLVRWQGWKGVWEEDHAVIAESAPELVKQWEAKVEAAGKEKAKAGQKKRGRPAGKKIGGAVKGPMTARKAVSKSAGGRGMARRVVMRSPVKMAEAVPKGPKKIAVAAPKSPKKPAKAAVREPKKTAAASKKKVGPTASPKKAMASPRKEATKTKTVTKGKASGSGAGAPKKRGRPPMKK